jgi:hypothetical protein
MLTAAMMSGAYACGPPQVGDKFSYNDGPVFEAVKVKAPDCFNIKLYLCTINAAKRSCRWVDFDRELKHGLSFKTD